MFYCWHCECLWAYHGSEQVPYTGSAFVAMGVAAIDKFAHRLASAKFHETCKNVRSFRSGLFRELKAHFGWPEKWQTWPFDRQYEAAKNPQREFVGTFSGAHMCPKGWEPKFKDDVPDDDDVYNRLRDENRLHEIEFLTMVRSASDWFNANGIDPRADRFKGAVSYTHLTLPTKRIV